MELLRIVAMLLVLTVHAGFFSLGAPTPTEALAAPLSTLSRLFFQSVSVIAVLVFVLISGWFGLKPTVKGVVNFLFQCLFYSILLFIVMLCLGRAQCTWKSIQNVLLYVQSFWFIKAYLCLMIFSPVLNAFVQSASKSQFRHLLIAFFLFQSIYGWLTTGAPWIERGYSAISFMGLYLLARYVRLYPCALTTLSKKNDLLLYGGVVMATTLAAFAALRLGSSSNTIEVLYRLTNPLIIAEALFLTLFFSKINIQKKWINWTASSCFAVFLIQQNPYIGRPIYAKTITHLFSTFSGPLCVLLIAAFIFALFIFSIGVDQIRKAAWRLFCKLPLNNKQV